MAFTQIRNDRTSYYEIHITGCAHTKFTDDCRFDLDAPEGTLAVDVAEMEAARNEGCLYVLAPCARKGTGVKAGQTFGNIDF